MKTEDYLEYLKQQSFDYQPSSDITAKLSEKVIVPIVGPTTVGKTTIIAEVERLDEAAGGATEFTTRPQRPGENTSIFRFLPHNEESLKQIKAKAQARQLVQYVVHPTDYVYGTELKDYPKEFNLMPILSSVMPTFRTLSFKSCIPIALVTDPDTWEMWYKQRSSAIRNPEDATKRLYEARQSLEWCLAEPDISWVHNEINKPEEAAEQIITIMHTGQSEDMGAHLVGEKLLERIESLLGK